MGPPPAIGSLAWSGSMKQRLVQIVQRADAFCARLNDGLVAVAIVLALVTTAALVQRLPVLLLQFPAPVGIDAPLTADPPAGN
jgi:hypothetical protein